MPDLLIEVGVEELPASACREALDQAPGLVTQALAEARLAHEGQPEVWVSPRRIAVVVGGLAAERPGRRERRRGPGEAQAFSDGRPTRAAEGFARGQGVSVSDLVVGEDGGRRFVFAEIDEPSSPAGDLVPAVVEALIGGLRFGKAMRWGDGRGLRFSRPVRWIVALLGTEAVPFEAFGIAAGRESQGHRFLGHPVAIADAAGYRDQLREVGVIADHAERRAAITEGLDTAAAALGCEWRDPGRKLEEVIHLVEWPSVLTGAVPEQHLALPERVLVTAMQSHQRYFPLYRDGALHPGFLAVSNGDPAHADLITRGNEDVLEARLQDAAFSFEVDRAAGIEALDARLETIVFHQRLGSLAAKRDRLVAGVEALASAAGIEGDALERARTAAGLAKIDQGAVLVAEFSDLEGYVGAEYVRAAGEPEEVATAVAEQYLPAGPSSPLPGSDVSALVAAAEKIDNLAGAFYVDEIPTGSKDPYALRRAAAGLVRILLDRGWEIPLRPLFRATGEQLRGQGADLELGDDPALDALEAFVAERLIHQLGTEGVPADIVAAALGAGVGGPATTADWARGLNAVRDRDEFRAAATAYTRLAKLGGEGPVDAAPAGDADEEAFAAAIAAAADEIEAARGSRRPEDAVAASARLAQAVDTFLADVMVNAEDAGVRERRLALVRRAAQCLGGAADYARVRADD